VIPRILVVVASALAVVAMLAVWVERQVLETDRWVDTSGELIRNEEIQDTTATFLADELASEAWVAARLAEILPPRLRPLAGPISGAAGEVAERVAKRALESGAFQDLWDEANRRTHEQLVAIVEDDDSAGPEVFLDLRPMLGRVAQRIGLGPEAEARLAEDSGRIRIMREDEVESIQTAGKLLKGLALVTTLLVLALLIAAVTLARGNHRRILLGSGMGLATAALVVLVVRRVAGDSIVQSLTDGGAAKPAADATWTIGTSLLSDIALSALVLGLLLVVGCLLAGPARWATRARSAVAPVVREHPALAYAVAAVVLLLLLAASALPAGARPLAILAYAGVVFGGVYALRRQVVREFPA
jgi:hypothetical protein